MKTGLLPVLGRRLAIFFLTVACAQSGRSQAPSEYPGTEPAPQYTVDQLDQLLGPIALYPDPLVALILPAAASPGDIVSAASYVAAQGDPYAAGSQPWSESIKALVHYPEVVEWMAQNLTWVQAVGAAFVADPADVMQAIQRLRQRARDLGTLVDTPQQQVVDEDGLIEILPAEPDVIYVPRYDPSVVFVQPFEAGGAPYIGFGPPFRSGVWLTYGFDWHRRALWVGRFSRDGEGWQRPNAFSPGAHVWHPPAQRPFPENRPARPSEPFVRPNLLPGAPAAPRPPDERWNRFTPRPAGSAPSTFGQHPGLPGNPPGVQPGFPTNPEWAREQEMRAREARERAARASGAPQSQFQPQSRPHPNGPPQPQAHPATPPPKPPPPKPQPQPSSPPADASATDPQKQYRNQHP